MLAIDNVTQTFQLLYDDQWQMIQTYRQEPIIYLLLFLECLQVMKHPVLKQQQAIIPSVAGVLAWSQGYMRRREVSVEQD